MYVITNGHSYIGVDLNNVATVVSIVEKALVFSDEKKALNYITNLKAILRKFNWYVVNIDSKEQNSDEKEENCGEYTYVPTILEQSEFNISDFFNNAIDTMSQLKDYANNMAFLECEYNKKILDVRHYKRDVNTKLSAIQLQRLEQFEIQLERERYECKSNRMIADFFLDDLDRLKSIEYKEKIKNIKESEYKPRVLTYELLDEIVGKKKRRANG